MLGRIIVVKIPELKGEVNEELLRQLEENREWFFGKLLELPIYALPLDEDERDDMGEYIEGQEETTNEFTESITIPLGTYNTLVEARVANKYALKDLLEIRDELLQIKENWEKDRKTLEVTLELVSSLETERDTLEDENTLLVTSHAGIVGILNKKLSSSESAFNYQLSEYTALRRSVDSLVESLEIANKANGRLSGTITILQNDKDALEAENKKLEEYNKNQAETIQGYMKDIITVNEEASDLKLELQKNLSEMTDVQLENLTSAINKEYEARR